MTSSTAISDFLIVGNGIMGLSLAYELRKADPSASITVVGPAARKTAATPAAGAMINVFAELADDQFDDPAMKARSELSLNAFSLWDPLCEDLSNYTEEPVCVEWGSYIYKTPGRTSQEDRTLAFIQSLLQERGLPYSPCSGTDLEWFNPKSRTMDPNMLHVPDGRIDPLKVLSAYECFLDANNVQMIDGTVSALHIDDGSGSHAASVSNSSEKITAKNVILANGSFAQELVDPIPELRNEVPRLVWGAGAALDAHFADWVGRMGGLDPNIFKLDRVVRSLVRDNACGLHVVPKDDGSFYIGASAAVLAEYEEFPRLHAIESIMQRAVEEISKAFFLAGVKLRGPGHRPVSADCYPLLGQSHIPGLWYSNGMKRDGFTCSPYISKHLAAEMLGSQSDLPGMFAPSRRLIPYKTREKAIEESIVSDLQGELMHGMQLSAYGEANYLKARRAATEEIYDRRAVGEFGIHPEVLHLYDNDEYFALIDHPRAPLGQ